MTTMPYRISKHAKERISERFGIKPEHARNWVNDTLRHSVKAGTQENGTTIFQHRTKDIFLVVNEEEMLVVTTMERSMNRVKITSSFLNPMVPQLKRDLEKMRRDYVRQFRTLEKEHAELAVNYGLALKRRANVCNPKTQQLIMKDAELLQTQMSACKAQQNQLAADYDLAKTKVEVFLRSISGEEA